jgi:hypothetical protein
LVAADAPGIARARIIATVLKGLITERPLQVEKKP